MRQVLCTSFSDLELICREEGDVAKDRNNLINDIIIKYEELSERRNLPIRYINYHNSTYRKINMKKYIRYIQRIHVFLLENFTRFMCMYKQQCTELIIILSQGRKYISTETYNKHILIYTQKWMIIYLTFKIKRIFLYIRLCPKNMYFIC